MQWRWFLAAGRTSVRSLTIPKPEETVMRPFRLRRPRYADVAATLALFVAMGGTAYAVATVNTADIVNGAVTTPKLHDAAVTTPKLHDGAVMSPKLANGSIITVKLADGSVATAKLIDGSVTNSKLADGSVTTAKLVDGSVTNSKLGTGSVTHSKLSPDSIDGSDVLANSLTLSDLLGANVNGSISFSLGAHSCGNLGLGVSGAQVGQIVVFSFTGTTAIPGSVVFGGSRVTAANTITVRACNVSASSMSVTGLGIHIATFG